MSPVEYKAKAAQFSVDAGMTYRYGASAVVDNTNVPNWPGRTDQNFTDRPFTWQVGGPRSSSAGSYSTNQAQVAFVADNPAVRVGVSDLQMSGYMFNTFSQSPQLSWVYAAATNRAGGLDSINIGDYKEQGIVGGAPIATSRCTGRSGFCIASLTVFQDGLIATAGGNTGRNKTTLKLPANKVPTAIAMTNNSEFALVTVWDTDARKGQVAVISMAGLCDNCSPTLPNGGQGFSAWYRYWEEWMAVYPGLVNRGNIAFMKLLGYIDLPGVNEPTEISVTSGLDQFTALLVSPTGELVGGFGNPLTDESNRQSFNGNGRNAGRYSKAGVAVVISKSEQKATFIDLKPLFTYVNGVYFGGTQQTFSSTVSNLGQADNQWPHSFAFKPEQMPTVIKTVDLPNRPTAVKTSLWGSPQRAWIATEEGSLRIFSLGNYVSGGASTPNDIAQVGSVAVGANPTSISYSKADPDRTNEETLLSQVLVLSRGERKVDWVHFSGNTGTVVRTLKDQRLVDPVAIDDVDNFATMGHVLSIADYGGKAVRTYRYGPVIFADRGSGWNCQPPAGCGVLNGGQFEYGGSFAMPGKTFMISGTNVP